MSPTAGFVIICGSINAPAALATAPVASVSSAHPSLNLRRRLHEDPSALCGQERRVALPGRRDRVRRDDPGRPALEADAGYRDHLPRGPARLRPRLAPRAAPTVHRQ